MDLSSNPLVASAEKVVNFIANHKNKFIAGVGLGVAAVVGFVGYSAYSKKLHAQAHTELMAVIKMIDETARSKNFAKENTASDRQAPNWSSIGKRCQEGYEKYKRTKLGPVFLVYQADALQHVDLAKSMNILSQALDQLVVSSVKEYFECKYGLMHLDSDDTATVEKGIELLKKIANNPHHAAHDQSLYHLGNYFWNEKKFDEARNYWQQFVVKYSEEKALAQYVEKVKEYLELLAV